MKKYVLGEDIYPLLKKVFGLPADVRKVVITAEVNKLVTIEVEQFAYVDPDEEIDEGYYHLVPAQGELF